MLIKNYDFKFFCCAVGSQNVAVVVQTKSNTEIGSASAVEGCANAKGR